MIVAFTLFGEEFTLAGIGAILAGLGSMFTGLAALRTAKKKAVAEEAAKQEVVIKHESPRPNTPPGL